MLAWGGEAELRGLIEVEAKGKLTGARAIDDGITIATPCQIGRICHIVDNQNW